MPESADDDTIRLVRPIPPRPRAPRSRAWLIVVPVVVVALGAAGIWLLWRPTAEPPTTVAQIAAASSALQPQPAKPQTEPAATRPEPPPAVQTPVLALAPLPRTEAMTPEPAPTPPAPPDYKIETGNEQTILDHVPTDPAQAVTVFRFLPNPRILVLDFASLREQGLMLNRAAAFVEKSGLPHDRLLTETELDDAIRASGDTVETYYYGHDYGAGSLSRFFSTADRDNIRLLDQERALHHLIRQEGWFDPDARAGLISIPRVGADQHVTLNARATILHHELSHGEYFTNPAYAAFVHHFWTQVLTAGERDRIRAHLSSLGYDAQLEDVMENEAQAYLMFTYGREFFTPEMIGMGKARLAELRNGFYTSMPAGWLRDSLGQFLNANKAASARP